jgi:hypothetical protein
MCMHGSQLELISWLLVVKFWTRFAERKAKVHEAITYNYMHVLTIYCPYIISLSNHGPTKQCLMDEMPMGVSWS